jgi:hypothetical protein
MPDRKSYGIFPSRPAATPARTELLVEMACAQDRNGGLTPLRWVLDVDSYTALRDETVKNGMYWDKSGPNIVCGIPVLSEEMLASE